MEESRELLVVNMPYEDGGGFKSGGGAAGAPKAIEQEIKRWPWRQSEDGYPVKFRFIDIPGEGKNLLDNFSRVMSRRLNQNEKRICVVGGDNSISFHSAFELWKYEPNYGLILFDRHPDCAEAFTDQGEEKDPHAYWLSALVGIGRMNPILDPKKTVLLGIGDSEKNEEAFLKQHKIKNYKISSLRNYTHVLIPALYDEILNNKVLNIKSWGAIHIVIDVDVMTASEVPATGVRRGGGLNSGEMINFIKMVKLFIREAGIKTEVWNLVEARVDKEKDPGMITIVNAASLLYEIAA